MKIGVVRFPGTNCDRDVWQMLKELGHQPQWCWHRDRFALSEVDAIVVPGGFSYGDYLRCGALAAKSPVMASVREFAAKGGPVLGICNGFQVLCESGLLVGALVRNESLRFVDDWVRVRLAHTAKVFLSKEKAGTELRLPVAHGEGRFVCEEATLQKLWDHQQVWLTYLDNPNGSLQDIAGIMNESRNVMALMPHPERAVHEWMGSADGGRFLS